MSEVLQTNVFFVITSVSVVLLTVFGIIALWYLIRILRNLKEMTDRLRRGSEQLAEDAQAVRTFVHEGIVGTVGRFIKNIVSSPTTRTQKKKGTEDD